MKLAQFYGIELYAHLIDLLDPDPMLPGDRPAHRDTQLENLAAQFLGTQQFTGLVGVVENQGMEVAVTGVEHVGHG